MCGWGGKKKPVILGGAGYSHGRGDNMRWHTTTNHKVPDGLPAVRYPATGRILKRTGVNPLRTKGPVPRKIRVKGPAKAAGEAHEDELTPGEGDREQNESNTRGVAGVELPSKTFGTKVRRVRIATGSNRLSGGSGSQSSRARIRGVCLNPGKKKGSRGRWKGQP